MMQNVSGVLSQAHRRMQAVLGYRQPDLGYIADCACRELSHRNRKALRPLCFRVAGFDRNRCSRTARRLLDFEFGFMRITSDKLAVTIHDEFRRIRVVFKKSRIVLLPLRPFCRRKRIDPAVVIPIIDVLFERDDLRSGYRLLLLQLLQEGIRRRTAGTSLGSEQLNHHWLAPDFRGQSFALLPWPRRGSTQEATQKLALLLRLKNVSSHSPYSFNQSGCPTQRKVTRTASS